MKKIKLLTLLAAVAMLAGCKGNTPASTTTPNSTPAPISTTSAPISTTTVMTTLTAPVTKVEGTKVSWTAVENAESYNVYVNNGAAISVTSTSYTVPMNGSVAEKTITVEAVKGTIVSPKSTAVKITYTADEFNVWTKDDLKKDWEINGPYKDGVGEGLDLGGDVTDQSKDGKSSIANCVAVTESNKILTLTMRAFKGQDGSNPHGAQVVVKVDGTVVKAAGYETDHVTLPMNTDTNFAYNYDLSASVGKTVALEVEQIYESSYHCVIAKVEMHAKDVVSSSTETNWNKAKIVNEWMLAGSYREGVGEGYDINSYDNGVRSSISKALNITEDTKTLTITARMFLNQDGAGTTEDPFRTANMYVRVNGDIVSPLGFSTDYAPVRADTDAQYSYFFDLSAYVGKTVAVAISEDSGKVGHCVIESIKLSNETKLANTSTRHSYTKDQIVSDWIFTGSYHNINEGIELSSSRDNRASMSKLVAITQDNCIMGLNVRAFASTTADPEIVVRADSNKLVAIGDTKDSFTVYHERDGESAETRAYNLSAYIGKTVLISICSENQAANQAVVQAIGFNGLKTEVASVYNKDNIEANFIITGKYDIYNEGVNVNTWDGEGALYGCFVIPTDRTTLEINARMFAGQDGSGTEADPYKNGRITVFFNGVAVTEATEKVVLSAATDEDQIFTYDFSAYAGTMGVVTILLDGKTGHNCIQTITFKA